MGALVAGIIELILGAIMLKLGTEMLEGFKSSEEYILYQLTGYKMDDYDTMLLLCYGLIILGSISLILSIVSFVRFATRSQTNSTSQRYHSQPKVTCPKCGLIVDSSKFCKNCGYSLATVLHKQTATMAICEKCGKRIPNNVKFCPECGEKRIKVIKPSELNVCQKCGATLSHGTKFCHTCGAEMKQVDYKVRKTCRSCGAILQSGLKYCPSCGDPVE